MALQGESSSHLLGQTPCQGSLAALDVAAAGHHGSPGLPG